MLEKYSIKFKVNKINNLKKGLDVLNSTNNYTNFEADKKAVMDYSFNFVLKLMNSGSSLLDMFKVNMEPQIQELGEEILADKENVKNQEALNKALNDEEPLNNIQKDIYGTNEAKEAVNEKVRKRNILINDYKNPREGLKNYLLEKFMPIMYLNLDLGELADAIIDNDINYFNNHKEEIANIDSTIFADIYSDIYSEEYIESVLDTLGDIEVSEALNHYSETKVNKLDLVVGNLSDDDFESLKNDVIEFNKIRHDEETIEFSNKLSQNLELSRLVRSNYQMNAELLKTALNGLTPRDKDEYYERIADVIGLFVKDSFHINNVPLGLDRSLYENYDKVGAYFKDIILHSKPFGSESAFYSEGVDFDKIVDIAREKYAGKVYTSEEIQSLTRNLKDQGHAIANDGAYIYDTINENGRAGFDRLLNECLEGKSNLNQFNGEPLPKTSENIAKITAYINKCFNNQFRKLDNEFRFDEHNNPIIARSMNECGVSYEYIKNKSNSLLDPDFEAKKAIRKFNDSLNLYNVAGEELEALNEPYSHQGEKALLRAQVITSGLNVSKESPLLNDAISIYGHLKQVHESRGAFYWLFHPIRNYRENQALAKMKETLMTKYEFSEQELNDRINEFMENSINPINKEFLKETNHDKYLEVSNKEKEDAKERDNILSTTLTNINKYGTLTIPRDQIPNTTILESKKIKGGILIDDEEIVEEKIDMPFDKFIEHLEVQDTLLDQINIKVEENARQKIINDSKIIEIEKYIDSEGYNKDYSEAINMALRERDIMIDEIKNGKNPKYDIEKKAIELHKQIHKLNTEDRIDKYNEKLDEYNKSLDLKDIENAKDEESLKNAQKAYEDNEKVRAQNAKDREEFKKTREKLYNKIDKELAELQNEKETKELNEEYNKQFNSIDDSKRSNELSNEEASSLEKMSQKFGLDIEVDTNLNDTKAKDDIFINENEDTKEKELNK